MLDRSHQAGVYPGQRRPEETTVTEPTETTTPTATDHRPDLVTVIAHMRAKPGKEQELREALEALIHPTSQEEGYVNYDLHEGSRIRPCSISMRTGRALTRMRLT